MRRGLPACKLVVFVVVTVTMTVVAVAVPRVIFMCVTVCPRLLVALVALLLLVALAQETLLVATL